MLKMLSTEQPQHWTSTKQPLHASCAAACKRARPAHARPQTSAVDCLTMLHNCRCPSSLNSSIDVCDLQGLIPAYFLDVPTFGIISLMRGGTREDPLVLTIHKSW